ncbi:platelet basic protein [Orycteropus afer afer]|uniref:Platelet basic protein n=1 Tax=Orycteropus afer afer TaxID=1230840 RepID=A0AC54Z7G2_ORYAF|nr:platelet basic protein [Orycteropus afer afer]
MSVKCNSTPSWNSARPFGVLQVLLLLTLLLSALSPCTSQEINCEVVPLSTELRCMCVKTTSGIHPSYINGLQVNRAGAHCHKVEVIATLKDGRKICLDPEAPMVKKIVQKILESGGSPA